MTSGAAPGLWDIYSVDGSRRTWAGTRSDIGHATKEAVDAVGTWSPHGAVVEARVSFESGLTQRGDGEAFLDELHRSDLRHITELQIDVQPDRPAFGAERSDAEVEVVERREAEPLPEVGVRLRFSGVQGSGLAVVVRGPNRDRAEGLHSHLMTLLARHQTLRRIDVSTLVSALSIWPLALLGLGVSHWLGWARHDNKWEWQEIALMAVGALTAIGAGIAVRLLYPQLEIVEDGGKTRAERLGKSVAGGAVAIAVGVVASVVYAHT